MEQLENNHKKSWGGKREGAGRKPGSLQKISVTSLLSKLEEKSGGQSYEELLVEDFLTARLNNDTALMLKYHNLLSSKLMATLNEVQIEESEDAVNAKQQAFDEALNTLRNLQTNDK